MHPCLPKQGKWGDISNLSMTLNLKWKRNSLYIGMQIQTNPNCDVDISLPCSHLSMTLILTLIFFLDISLPYSHLSMTLILNIDIFGGWCCGHCCIISRKWFLPNWLVSYCLWSVQESQFKIVKYSKYGEQMVAKLGCILPYLLIWRLCFNHTQNTHILPYLVMKIIS